MLLFYFAPAWGSYYTTAMFCLEQCPTNYQLLTCDSSWSTLDSAVSLTLPNCWILPHKTQLRALSTWKVALHEGNNARLQHVDEPHAWQQCWAFGNANECIAFGNNAALIMSCNAASVQHDCDQCCMTIITSLWQQCCKIANKRRKQCYMIASLNLATSQKCCIIMTLIGQY